MFCHCYPWPVFPGSLQLSSLPTFYFLLTASTSCLRCWSVCFSNLKVHCFWTSCPEVRNPSSFLARQYPKDYPSLTWSNSFGSTPFSGCLTLLRACSGFLCPASSNLKSPIWLQNCQPTWSALPFYLVFAPILPYTRASLSPTLLSSPWLISGFQLRVTFYFPLGLSEVSLMCSHNSLSFPCWGTLPASLLWTPLGFNVFQGGTVSYSLS